MIKKIKVFEVPVINWLLFSSFVFSLVMTILGLMVDMTYHLQYKPKIQQLHALQEDKLAAYLQEDKKYQNHPLFKPYKNEKKDLASLLADIQKEDKDHPLIEAPVKKRVFAMGKDWLEQKYKIPEIPRVHQLFANIRDFDHWIVSEQTPSHLATDLVVAGQLSLAWTFYFKPTAIRQALENTRHLSKILLHTQNLSFKKAGLSLLEKESELMAHVTSRFHKSKFLWTPLSDKEIRNFRHHLAQTSAFLSPLSLQKVYDDVFFSGVEPMGFCAVFKRKRKLLQWSKIYLSPQFPLEPSFHQQLKNLDRVWKQAQTTCLNWPTDSLPKAKWYHHIPYYRRIYAVKMILNAERNLKVL